MITLSRRRHGAVILFRLNTGSGTSLFLKRMSAIYYTCKLRYVDCLLQELFNDNKIILNYSPFRP